MSDEPDWKDIARSLYNANDRWDKDAERAAAAKRFLDAVKFEVAREEKETANAKHRLG